jgi:hypothetical protein
MRIVPPLCGRFFCVILATRLASCSSLQYGSIKVKKTQKKMRQHDSDKYTTVKEAGEKSEAGMMKLYFARW